MKYDPRRLIEDTEDEGLIFYSVEVIVVDNVIKRYCIKTYLSHSEAWNRFDEDIHEMALAISGDRMETLYFENKNRSNIFYQEQNLKEKNYGLFEKKQISFAYMEKSSTGECFTPLTIKELKESYEKEKLY